MKLCAALKPFKPHTGLECRRAPGHQGMHLDWIDGPNGPQRVSWFAPDRLVTNIKNGQLP